jgi:hypothetical protein
MFWCAGRSKELAFGFGLQYSVPPNKCRKENTVMSPVPGWFEQELLETFYLIVEEYRSSAIDEQMFFDKLFKIADRYARHAGKEENSRNQMTLFSS